MIACRATLFPGYGPVIAVGVVFLWASIYNVLVGFSGAIARKAG
jgi:hypothetical protein